MRRPRLVHVVAAATAFAAVAAGATGGVLLSRFRAAAVAGLAERQAMLVEARARLVEEELARLVEEMVRLSRLAEVDLEDRNPEPEKSVLRIARRDTALFSAAIAILGPEGELVWSEPAGAEPARRAALVGEAQGRGRAVVALAPGEIDVAAPIAGHGAIVGIVSGRGRDLFGRALHEAVASGGSATLGGEEGAVVAALGPPPPELPRGAGQRWGRDAAGGEWLVTEVPLEPRPLVLRVAQPVGPLLAPIEELLRGLAAVAAVSVALALAGGGGVALALGRVAQAEEEVLRSRELAAVGKTGAAIAHEVKNSLNGLSIALDLLASGRAAPEAARAVHAQARAEIGRLRGVAEDLTLFAATPRLELTALDLGELCRRAAAASADLAAEVGAAVELALPGQPVEVRGDEAKLLSALLNLARNGLEAMGPGAFGEPLGSAPRERPRRLLLAARAEGGRAVLEVADTGAGLPAEVRGRLFQPFVSTKRTGTGLGLAIARRVAEAHGGTIEAADRPGGGTIFRLAVPLPAGPAAGGGG